MTLADIITLFDKGGAGTHVGAPMATQIVKTLRETEDELGTLRREVAAQRTVVTPNKKVAR